MPVVYQQDIDRHTKLGVWHITEAEAFFEAFVSVQRIITHPHKRLQHLAGRFLLQYLFPQFPVAAIQLTPTGKPWLTDDSWQFSISHCGDYAAAIVATKGRVGIDIEIPKPAISNIQHKFLGTGELVILNQYPCNFSEMLTAAWSVKEALFKWYGLGQVDFKNDMVITGFKEDPLAINCVFKKEMNFHACLPVQKIEHVMLTYVVSDY